MDIHETMRAFQCCMQKSPDCAHCPQQGPGFGILCRQNMKDSVTYWLNVAKEAVKNWGLPGDHTLRGRGDIGHTGFDQG